MLILAPGGLSDTTVLCAHGIAMSASGPLPSYKYLRILASSPSYITVCIVFEHWNPKELKWTRLRNYNFWRLQYFLTLLTAILLGISAERVIREKLERIQERGLSAVFRDGQSTYEKLLNKAKLITLYERRPQDIACYMYKVKHGMCMLLERQGFVLSE